ncbi:CheR family methyltransferase [Salinirubrum litoreum]|uniref:protein-glutamate O-methyltransferase n=1 Tax=Salinirubrum litoreum TaxID=1126234 RepID=A0ABD5R9Y9_9EURY|nr:protein-glutamate O-methyltransferase CheR [Salinirubrum litoreum]
MSFQRLLDYVEREIGFATSYYNDAYLDRRISARMRRTDCDDYAEYRERLRADPDEPALLLDSLNVNVTGFFRNPETWSAVVPILRALTEERQRATLWSVPCADGREPYTLSMLALDDADVAASRLSILASDIDPNALASARDGVYHTTRTTDIAAELDPLSTAGEYVTREGDEFRVTDRVQSLVEFSQHDLIQDRPPGEFDMVVCRNLFIYIDAQYKRPIFETLDEALRPGGYLVIGRTETVHRDFKETFESVDSERRIYRKAPAE